MVFQFTGYQNQQFKHKTKQCTEDCKIDEITQEFGNKQSAVMRQPLL